jgi:hypothetical protein
MRSLLSDEKFFTAEIFHGAERPRAPARPAIPTSRNPTSTTA